MFDIHRPLRTLLLFLVGAALYCGVELLWRGHSHWSMALTGGFCFILIGLINLRCQTCLALSSQMLLSALIVTAVEYLTGTLVNRVLGLGVWDYSTLPYNLHGQICLLYSNLWFLLSLPAILLDDWLRYRWFGGDKPSYRLF